MKLRAGLLDKQKVVKAKMSETGEKIASGSKELADNLKKKYEDSKLKEKVQATSEKTSVAFKLFGAYVSSKASALKDKSQEIAQSEKFQRMKTGTKEGLSNFSEKVQGGIKDLIDKVKGKKDPKDNRKYQN